MIIVGIVAEYNPFHNGHSYQIKYAKEKLRADYVIIVMSGNFIQRGGPAICDKSIRARSAIMAGADLVLELPLEYALGDSVVFAQGAVGLLNQLGCHYVLFGSECGNLRTLSKISKAFLADDYMHFFSQERNSGKDTDTARINALKKYFNDSSNYRFVNQPNNLLGIYYICAILRSSFFIKPYTHLRRGQAYFSDKLPLSNGFASASAIRNTLFTNAVNSISNYVPDDMFSQLEKLYENQKLMRNDYFFQPIKNKLSVCSSNHLISFFHEKRYLDFISLADKASDYKDWMNHLSFYKISKVKIERLLFRFLLNCRTLKIDEIPLHNLFPTKILSQSNSYRNCKTLISISWDG